MSPIFLLVLYTPRSLLHFILPSSIHFDPPHFKLVSGQRTPQTLPHSKPPATRVTPPPSFNHHGIV